MKQAVAKSEAKVLGNEPNEGRDEALALMREAELDHPLKKVIKDDLIKVEMKQTERFVRSSFTAQQNVQLNNSLRYADTKAGALVTVNGLILSYLVKLIGISAGYSNMLFKGSLSILIISILYSISVVYPRALNSKDKGLIYWEHITNYRQDEYVKAIIEDETENLLKSSVENNYAQAVILTKKFKRLERGFKISIAGYIVIGLGLILKFII